MRDKDLELVAGSTASEEEPKGRLVMMSKGSFAALSVAVVALATTAIWAGDAAAAGTLDRLRQDKTLRIAYRQDAPPFSFQTGSAEPQGFIVDICRAVAKSLTQQLQLPSLNIV